MATLLAITVLLPLVGSLVLVLSPKLETPDGAADRARRSRWRRWRSRLILLAGVPART